jgi:hypothetical protein
MDVKKTLRLLLAGLGLGLSSCCAEESFGAALVPTAVGVRVSHSVTTVSEGFMGTELFTDWRLPWERVRGSGWYYAWMLELSAGALSQNRSTGFIGALGPVVGIGHRHFPLYLEMGISPALISRYQFEQRDFGGPFQFVSHVGLGYRFNSRFELEYRIQHMSNAGLETPNPGVNLQSVGLRVSF